MSAITIAGLVLTGLVFPQEAATANANIPPADGVWQAWLESPGGDLPFALELTSAEHGKRAALLHGPTRTVAARVTVDAGQLSIEWPDYDSKLVLQVSDGGTALDGHWERQRDAKSRTKMTCRARFGGGGTPGIPAAAFLPAAPGGPGAPPITSHGHACAPRYRVTFAGDTTDAVALLQESELGALQGTMLTVLGDYRYLTGRRTGTTIELACFDAAHAFLFRARQQSDGSLTGDFWSADQWQQKWTAQPDPLATLPDAYGVTKLRGNKLGKLAFDDLHGVRRQLEGDLLGEVTLVLLFGSWCPNCHDATKLLAKLGSEYGDRDVKIVSLAFELTNDVKRNRATLQAYATAHRVGWPILLAGPADKEQATKVLPFLDKLIAYPTVLFVDRTATIRAVYTGFTGPAAPAQHAQLAADWRQRIESLLR